MENRAISPLVLGGGLLAAALVGFVAARSLGDGAPPVPVTAAAGDVAGQEGVGAPLIAGADQGTEALIDPVEETPAPAAAPLAAARPTPPPPAAAPPARPRTTTDAPRPAPRPAAPAALPAPTRAASGIETRPAQTGEWQPAPLGEAPVFDTTRSEPTWSRPFPAPESTESLPTRTAPRIDAPPPPPVTRTVSLPTDSVVGLQIEKVVSSETAEIEDEVQARVTRDVYADGVVVIPAGTRVTGSVTLVDEGGKVRERARLGVRFHTLVLADGTEVPLPTETIYRDGESPSRRSAARIGGAATAGAVIGAILGGGKGAAVGAAVGAGSGTAATMAGGRKHATLPAGQTVTARLSDAVTLTVPR